MTETHRGERIVAFTDAVVAIAITLLVLPLVDIATSAVEKTGSRHEPALLTSALAHSAGPLLGFVLSFLVVARLWWAHHALFERVERWTTAMVAVNVFWLLALVLLPWATAFATSTFTPDWRVSLLYVGTMTLASGLQVLLARLIVRATDGPAVGERERLYGNVTTLIAFATALVICVALPQTYFIPLILLAFTGLVDKRVHRRLTLRAASGEAE